MTRLQHFDTDGTARFVTFGTYARYPIFDDANLAQLLLRHIDGLRQLEIRILGYVIMPDHVHLVLLLPVDMRLGRVIGQMKGRAAQEIVKHWPDLHIPVPGKLRTSDGKRRHTIWQKRCYDRNIRDIRELRETLVYCHANPSKKGLIETPGDWPWSSYSWYQGRRDVPLCLDDWVL